MIDKINVWLIIDESPLMSSHYQFGFKICRLNKRQERRLVNLIYGLFCKESMVP